MKYAIVFLACFIVAPAFADPATIDLSLTQDEGRVLLNTLDASVRQGGYSVAKSLVPTIDKIIAAGAVADQKNEAAKIKAAVDEASKPVAPKP